MFTILIIAALVVAVGVTIRVFGERIVASMSR